MFFTCGEDMCDFYDDILIFYDEDIYDHITMYILYVLHVFTLPILGGGAFSMKKSIDNSIF